MFLRSTVVKSALLSLLLVALAGCSTPQPAAQQPAAPQPAAPQPITEGWQTVAPENAGFSADFPGTPTKQTQTSSGGVTYVWIYGSKKLRAMVLASTTDYYGAVTDANEMFRQEEKGFLEASKAKATSHKRARMRGANGKMLPAAIFTFTVGNGLTGVSKATMDGNTMYVTVVMWAKGAHAAGLRKRFMSSFKLLPRTRPPEPEAAKQ